MMALMVLGSFFLTSAYWHSIIMSANSDFIAIR